MTASCREVLPRLEEEPDQGQKYATPESKQNLPASSRYLRGEIRTVFCMDNMGGTASELVPVSR